MLQVQYYLEQVFISSEMVIKGQVRTSTLGNLYILPDTPKLKLLCKTSTVKQYLDSRALKLARREDTIVKRVTSLR